MQKASSFTVRFDRLPPVPPPPLSPLHPARLGFVPHLQPSQQLIVRIETWLLHQVCSKARLLAHTISNACCVERTNVHRTLRHTCSRTHTDQLARDAGCKDEFLDELLVLCGSVHLAASQEIFRRGDISQELVLLADGAAEVSTDGGSGDAVIALVDSGAPDRAPCVGEVAFFLRVVQPYNVRAHSRADVRVLALSREDGEGLLRKFPDQRELICGNLLRAHGLAPDGSLAGGEDADEDPYRAALRGELRAAITQRGEEAFASLVIAAQRGDLDAVRRLLSPDMIQRPDYDGRTALAHAAAEGAYRVAELLVAERADVGSMNRWGRTPLDEAAAARHGPVVQLLAHRRGATGDGSRVGALVEAASAGDTERVTRILQERRLDPNAGDYDARTGA